MRELCLLSAYVNIKLNTKIRYKFSVESNFFLNDMHLIENVICFGKQIFYLIRLENVSYLLFI